MDNVDFFVIQQPTSFVVVGEQTTFQIDFRGDIQDGSGNNVIQMNRDNPHVGISDSTIWNFTKDSDTTAMDIEWVSLFMISASNWLSTLPVSITEIPVGQTFNAEIRRWEYLYPLLRGEC